MIDQEYAKNNYTNYLEMRKYYISSNFQLGNSLAKYILTFSISILGFTLTFINQIFTNFAQGTIWLLFISWIGFICSALLTLLSLKFSQEAHQEFLDILDIQFLEGKFDKKAYSENKKAKNTKRYLEYSIKCFILSTISLFLFVCFNLY